MGSPCSNQFDRDGDKDECRAPSAGADASSPEREDGQPRARSARSGGAPGRPGTVPPEEEEYHNVYIFPSSILHSMSPRYTRLLLAGVLVAALLLAAGCLAARETAAGPGGPAGPVNLTYYTEEHPPYNYRVNGTLKGFAVDLLEAVSAKAGRPVTRDEVRVAPWSEGYQAALAGNGTVLFAMARLPEREQSFRWVGPIYTDRNVLFAKRDSGITIRSPDDLGGYRIRGGDRRRRGPAGARRRGEREPDLSPRATSRRSSQGSRAARLTSGATPSSAAGTTPSRRPGTTTASGSPTPSTTSTSTTRSTGTPPTRP